MSKYSDWSKDMFDKAYILVQAGLTTFEIGVDLFESFSDELDRDIPHTAKQVEHVMEAIQYARNIVR